MSSVTPLRLVGAPVDAAERIKAAERARDRLRSAIDDPTDREHESARDFRDSYGRVPDVVSFLECYDGEDNVERVVEAVKAHGLAEGYWADSLNLGLVALMVDEAYRPDAGGEVIVGRFVEGEDLTDAEREHVRIVSERIARELTDRERAEHLRSRGPHRIHFDR